MKNMPKQIILAVATTFLVASFFLNTASAQHYHGHDSFYHGYAQGHQHDGHPYDGGHNYYGDHVYDHDSYHHDSYHHGHDPQLHGYVNPPLAQVHSAPFAASPFEYAYGDPDVYCPATGDCPSQYQQPAQFGTPFQGDMAYQHAPYPNVLPGNQSNLDHSHDHAGHDHSDHSHDGHSHNQPAHGTPPTASSDEGYLQPPSLPTVPPAPRQPSVTPSPRLPPLPNIPSP